MPRPTSVRRVQRLHCLVGHGALRACAHHAMSFSSRCTVPLSKHLTAAALGVCAVPCGCRVEPIVFYLQHPSASKDAIAKRTDVQGVMGYVLDGMAHDPSFNDEATCGEFTKNNIPKPLMDEGFEVRCHVRVIVCATHGGRRSSVEWRQGRAG